MPRQPVVERVGQDRGLVGDGAGQLGEAALVLDRLLGVGAGGDGLQHVGERGQRHHRVVERRRRAVDLGDRALERLEVVGDRLAGRCRRAATRPAGKSFAPSWRACRACRACRGASRRPWRGRGVPGRASSGPREVGLGDDGGQQALQRGIGAREVLEVLAGDCEVGQRRQRDVAQEAVPLGDEVLVVELEHVLGERRDRDLGALRAAAGEDRAVERRLGRDVLQPGEHDVVEAGVGEDARRCRRAASCPSGG